jgi:hypothetical protein
MQVRLGEELEAVARVRHAERTQQLLAAARGHSWFQGRLKILVQIGACAVLGAAFSVKEMQSGAAIAMITWVMGSIWAVERDLTIRLDALLGLLELGRAPAADSDGAGAWGQQPK